MEELINEIINNPAIIAGVPLEFQDIPEGKRKAAIIMACHCCLNGPVGVNTVTTFPLISSATSIKSVLGCTNSSWRGLCESVAKVITRIRPNMNCNMIRAAQGYWPLVEYNQKKAQ